MGIPHVITSAKSLHVFIDSKQLVFTTAHPNYKAAMAAFKDGNETELLKLHDIPKVVSSFGKDGVIEVKDGEVYYSGEPLRNTFTRKILQFISEGLPYTGMLKFLEKLYKNPAKHVLDQLPEYVDRYGIALTDEGDMLMYKRVREDWTDFHTSTISNVVGAEISMPRNKVDDNVDSACSAGLHCGAMDYVAQFNSGHTGHIVVVRVDPGDVVCIPRDHEWAKVRVCRYKVICEFSGELTCTVYKQNTDGSVSSVVGARSAVTMCDDDGDDDYDDDGSDIDYYDDDDNGVTAAER